MSSNFSVSTPLLVIIVTAAAAAAAAFLNNVSSVVAGAADAAVSVSVSVSVCVDAVEKLEPCPSGQKCIRKCCPNNFHMTNVSSKKCVNQDGEGGRKTVNIIEHDDIRSHIFANDPDERKLIYGFPCRRARNSGLLEYKYDFWTLKLNSKSNIEIPKGMSIHGMRASKDMELMACFEYTRGGRVKLFVWENFHAYLEEPFSVRGYKICLILSMVATVFTFVVYAAMPPKKTTHEKSLMNFLAAFFVADLTLYLDMIRCYTRWTWFPHLLGFARQYSNLVAYFWLNCMCFDIWTTLSGTVHKKPISSENASKWFRNYCIYSWCIPTVILVITMHMQYAPYIDNGLRPFGATISAWFAGGEYKKFLYQVGFTYFTLALNIMMLISTLISVHKVYRMNKRTNLSKQKSDRNSFLLSLKLCVIMGLPVSVDIFCHVLDPENILFHILEFSYALQGVFICLAFACRKRVLMNFKQKFPKYSLVRRTNKTQDQSLSGNTYI